LCVLDESTERNVRRVHTTAIIEQITNRKVYRAVILQIIWT